MSDATNHALLVISLFIAWSVAVFLMGGSKIFFDYDTFKDADQ